MVRLAVPIACVAAALASSALAQTSRPPPQVAIKMQVMDTACGIAGGRPAGGTYIFAQDFSGDGVKDYLLSEGSYQCAGKPEAFRPGGRAIVEIYVTQGADAPRAFYETVRGYRIIPGSPSQVQVVRDGGTVTLRYDAASRKFVTGGAPSPAVPVAQGAPVDPLAGVGPRGAAPVPSAAAAPVAAGAGPETQAAFLTRCQRERMTRYKGLTAAVAKSSCEEIWRQAQAAMGPATALMAVGGGAPGPMTQAATRALIPGVTWGGKVGPGVPSSGKLGTWEVSLHGQTLIDGVQYLWAKVGQPIPYDIPEAMRIKGARVSEVACQNLGGGEATRVYRVDAAGRPPFALTVYDRDAPTANANSTYSVMADLKGQAPTLAALKRTAEGADYTGPCVD
jgi:hypothetical protein